MLRPLTNQHVIFFQSKADEVISRYICESFICVTANEMS